MDEYQLQGFLCELEPWHRGVEVRPSLILNATSLRTAIFSIGGKHAVLCPPDFQFKYHRAHMLHLGGWHSQILLSHKLSSVPTCMVWYAHWESMQWSLYVWKANKLKRFLQQFPENAATFTYNKCVVVFCH